MTTGITLRAGEHRESMTSSQDLMGLSSTIDHPVAFANAQFGFRRSGSTWPMIGGLTGTGRPTK